MIADWAELLSWIRAPPEKKHSLLRKLAAQSTVFHLWKQRNNIIYNHTCLTPTETFRVIEREMRNIISAKKDHKLFKSLMVL
ncbi:hypothetical protein BRARA_A01130 [Brassica rapa]|uniref:Uncharacterized protein n=1 Tax=Brassica campestris TaxID=3711 RepID=A0A398ASQ2_BRACM|nr:hypothetical protein BRARA_A01130 [Brassica rapa]